MALQPANHYVISEKGIDAVIETARTTGDLLWPDDEGKSESVDRSLRDLPP